MEPADLQGLLDQLVSYQAKYDQERAQQDEMSRIVVLVTKHMGVEGMPVLMKVAQTLGILRASTQMSANAVDELSRFVAEQRGE
jgi:predicted patatin/cPLA2 family phospholipase